MAWRRIAPFVVLAVAGACGKSESSAPAPDASIDDDAGVDAGIPESPRAPSPRKLRDLVGLATNPGDFPIDDGPAAAAHRAFTYKKLTEAGFHRIRRDFLWSVLEPSRGAFDFARYDRMVDEAKAAGIELLADLLYGNPWATKTAGADEYYPPDDPADFAHFASAVAAHYTGKIHEYEIWNEPNNGFRFWKGTLNGDPVRFGALAYAAAGAVRAADPSARVAYGGTVYITIVRGPDFAAQSFAANQGLSSAINAFAMHGYSIYPPERGPESSTAYEIPLYDKIATMSGLLLQVSHASSDIPIWITELGWPVTKYTSEAQQARLTVRALVIAALGGADGAFVYTMGDGPHPEADPPEDAFGLVGYHADWSDGQEPRDKAAFVGIKSLLGAVGDYAVSKRLAPTDGDAWVVEVKNGASSAWVAWRGADAEDAGPGATVTIPTTGPTRVVAMDGTSRDETATPITLAVGVDPVFVVPR